MIIFGNPRPLMTAEEIDETNYAEECGRASVAKTEEAAWNYAKAFFKSELEQYSYIAGWNLMAIHRNGGI